VNRARRIHEVDYWKAHSPQPIHRLHHVCERGYFVSAGCANLSLKEVDKTQVDPKEGAKEAGRRLLACSSTWLVIEMGIEHTVICRHDSTYAKQERAATECVLAENDVVDSYANSDMLSRYFADLGS
jgi:hypothetical protein